MLIPNERPQARYSSIRSSLEPDRRYDSASKLILFHPSFHQSKREDRTTLRMIGGNNGSPHRFRRQPAEIETHADTAMFSLRSQMDLAVFLEQLVRLDIPQPRTGVLHMYVDRFLFHFRGYCDLPVGRRVANAIVQKIIHRPAQQLQVDSNGNLADRLNQSHRNPVVR